MRTADCVINTLTHLGVVQGFSVSGGTIVHLLDAIGAQTQMNIVYCHHEQACAMAAETYARTIGLPALVLISNGPAVTNTLTGVAAAFIDSIPVIIISGEVKDSSRADAQVPEIRQGGIQQVATSSLVASVTKGFFHVRHGDDVRQALTDALSLATTGRQGPVWVEIPIDVQSGECQCGSHQPGSSTKLRPAPAADISKSDWVGAREMVLKAERPLVVLGSGLRVSPDLLQGLKELAKYPIPTVATWGIRDYSWHLGNNFMGSIGVSGDRAANLVASQSDLIISLGSRLHTTHTSYDLASFAPHASLLLVDIDEAESKKFTNRTTTFQRWDFHDGVGQPLEWLGVLHKRSADWFSRTQAVVEWFASLEEPYERLPDHVNSFDFVRALDRVVTFNCNFVLDAGTAYRGTLPTLSSGEGRRVLFAGGLASMGSGLPGLVGAHFADPGTSIIGLFGDGGVQMNIQELETIAYWGIPAKMIILKDNGYMAISNTQRRWFENRLQGSSFESGLSTPNFCALAKSYGLESTRLEPTNLEMQIRSFLELQGAAIMTVPVPRNQSLMPRMDSRQSAEGFVSPPMHDMFPFLERQTLAELVDWLRGFGGSSHLMNLSREVVR